MARLVINHSTFLPGLLKLLKKISLSNSLNTIIPGRLYKAKSNSGGNIKIKMTTSTYITNDSNSYNNKSNLFISHQKLLVRHSSDIQEVFLVINRDTNMTRLALKTHLNTFLLNEAHNRIVDQDITIDEE